MSTESKTIDNLGIETSVRWARDQQNIDPKLIRESHSVPIHTQVTTTEPSFSSQIEELFSFNKKNSAFAKFKPPKGFHSHQLAIFTYQIVPSMGSYEKQEMNKEKIAAMKEEEERKGKKKKQKGKKKKEEVFTQMAAESEELKEIEVVTKMLEKIGMLDKYLSMINCRKEQYHKG